MPFVGLSRETGERIDITKIRDPRGELKQGDIVCQLCGQDMIVVAGTMKQHHFRHKVECPDRDYGRHPESAEHLDAKVAVAEYITKTFTEYAGASIEYEVKIPEVMRIADVLVTFPKGWKVAHEIQLSPISIEDLQQRTADYAKAEIDVVWWLGRSADTAANKNWCLEAFGIVYTLNISVLQSRDRS